MKHVWLINSQSSTTLFYRNYSEMKIDPDLLSGLLTALNNFSAVELGSSGISSIEMGGLRWVYHHEPDFHLMLIGADQMSANSQVMRSRLQVILKMFKQKYDITKEKMSKDLINVNEFESFNEELDLVRQQWEMAEKQFGPAQLFDVLGVFQQIFNAMSEIFKYNFYGESFDRIVSQLNEFAKNLADDLNVEGNEEYKKIKYDKKLGWSVINMNPMQLDGENLKHILFNILQHQKDILKEQMSTMSMLYAFNKYIYPFLMSQMEILDNLGLTKPLLNLFLSDN